MKFNHLNVPDSWQHYWTKYPEGYTIMEALISWVSQVDRMIDNVNNWNDYLESFVSQFDEELQTTVGNILNDWSTSGFLKELINEYTNERIDELDNIKISRGDVRITDFNTNFGKINEGHLSEELIAQITGQTPVGTTPVVGSVTTRTLANKAVTPEKTSFIDVSTNLVSPDRIEYGARYTGAGVKENNSAWNLVMVYGTPDVFYSAKNAIRATIFDKEGNLYLTRERLSTETDFFSFSTGAQGYTIYFTTPAASFATEQINVGQTLGTYEPYYAELSDDIRLGDNVVTNHNVIDYTVTEDKMGFLHKSGKQLVNLFSPDMLTAPNTYVRFQDGTVATIEGRSATRFIPFPQNEPYLKFKSHTAQPIMFYDKYFNHLASHTTNQAGSAGDISGYVGTSPAGTAYVRYTVFDTDVNSEYLYQSNGSQMYSMPTLISSSNGGAIASRTGVAFGDSITFGGTYTNDYPNYTNVGLSGTRLMDTGTANNHAQLAMVRLVDAITSGEWTAVETAAGNVSTEFANAVARLKAVNWQDTDFVTVFYGANDSGTVSTYPKTLGTLNSTDRTTWHGAITYVITELLTSYPHLQIYLFTPLYRSTENYITEPLANAMIEQAEKWKVDILDLHHTSGFNELTIDTYTNDGTHPNGLGNGILDRKISGFLNTHQEVQYGLN